MKETLDRLVERLLDAAGPDGHWSGELSSSALSTATATIALRGDPLVGRGLDWLTRTQRDDGGWGDTVLSISNISTTALCWAAFTIAGRPAPRAEEWLRRAAGSLEPDTLRKSIESRYGNDRTFSAPILMVLAVAGHVPWTIVPRLPFELAAFPQSWFRYLGLPVVSYALPALIAIGQTRANFVRRAMFPKTLRVLENIQPKNGGFLEATPLTSFVAIGLQAAGHKDLPVLHRCLQFLKSSVRPDGSWPIDTNLATWVTTLSVNALRDRLPADRRAQIREWLLAQQYKKIHPYTGAPPGGWAWTDLPGGVPDADDTAGALIALRNLGGDNHATAQAGIKWLIDLQNRDGGIPTFCRGWGKLPFDRSSPDITAHALLAFHEWKVKDPAVARAVAFLEQVQRPDGAWIPLWFGNQFGVNDENPVYGTSRVLTALNRIQPESTMAHRATEWLISAQNPDGGWGGDRSIESTIEETALATTALSGEVARRGARWLVEATRAGEQTEPAPIGFYFARLWYYERLYPLIFAVDALRRLSPT